MEARGQEITGLRQEGGGQEVFGRAPIFSMTEADDPPAPKRKHLNGS
jgi:hypothetical protein